MKEELEYLSCFLHEYKLDYDYRDLDEPLRTLDETIDFVEQVFEIAFGDDAIERDFSPKEVLTRLQQFSDNALIAEEME
jgi:hypothetical protein